MIQLCSEQAWKRLGKDLAVAKASGVALLLVQRGPGGETQYHSSLLPPSKQQLALLRRSLRARKRAAATAAVHAGVVNDAAAAAAYISDQQRAEDEQQQQQQLDEEQRPSEVVGVAILTARQQQQQDSCSCPCPCTPVYVWLAPPTAHLPEEEVSGQPSAPPLPPRMSSMLLDLLRGVGGDIPPTSSSLRPCVTHGATPLLVTLASLGLPLLPAHEAQLLDAGIMAWLLDPQLIQDSGGRAAADCYGLTLTSQRLGVMYSDAACQSAAAGPLARLGEGLRVCMAVAEVLLLRLQELLGSRVLQQEMQVGHRV